MAKKLADFPREEIARALENAVSLTLDMTEEELSQMASIASAEEYATDQYLITEDEEANDMYVIAKGSVGVELRIAPNTPSGAQIFKTHAGGILGEFAFVDGSRRSASVKMLEPTIVLHFNAEKLYALCESNLSIGYKIMRNLAILMAQRMRNINFELRSHLYL